MLFLQIPSTSRHVHSLSAGALEGMEVHSPSQSLTVLLSLSALPLPPPHSLTALLLLPPPHTHSLSNLDKDASDECVETQSGEKLKDEDGEIIKAREEMRGG